MKAEIVKSNDNSHVAKVTLEPHELIIFLKESPVFKGWVENTKLFQTLIVWSGTGVEIEGIDKDLYLRLNLSTTKISNFEELPAEMLIEFFINSPYHQSPKEISDNEDNP